MSEKVGTMLLTLADNIPCYQRQMAAIRNAKDAGQFKSMYPLMRAIIYVYEDIVGFIGNAAACLSIKKVKTVRSSSKILLLNVWKPLDVYLGELISRLQEHQMLLEEEITAFRLDSAIQAIDARGRDMDTETELTKLEMMGNQRRSRVREISELLDAPIWEDKPWDTLRRMTKDSGEWLFDQELFHVACNPSKDSRMKPAFVTIRAKSGYGKTFLCAQINDHLESMPRTTEASPDQRPLRTQVNYFFFSRLQERFYPSDTLRAVAAQLFRQNSEDWNIIKAASL
ncbi:hypothetical protein F5Y03DRAFT_399275 [Xylaria venustula]|nr:hypothetical protein F5Y03DRAFT_399275 [Xylaria venustula]